MNVTKQADNISCVILGAGGHASMIVDILKSTTLSLNAVILDADREKWNTEQCGLPVAGDDSMLEDLYVQGFKWFAVGVGTVDSSDIRKKLYDKALSYGLKPLSVIHPSAVISENAVLGEGVQIFPRSIVNCGAEVGENVILNSGSIVEHDDKIGKHVHLATGAKLAGNVEIGEGSFVGAGATVINGIKIGKNTIIGAGAVVISDIPDNKTAIGVPARIEEKR